MKHIRIAGRASALAMIQTNYVADAVRRLSPGTGVSIVKVTTAGDTDKSDFPQKSGSVGLFTSEVEKAVLEGRAEMAVHSLKDLPTAPAAGLVIAAIPARASAADAVVCGKAASSLKDLPPGTTVGTSSLRRIAQLRMARPDLEYRPMRGNIETRVRKVADRNVGAVVVARAALERLEMTDRISFTLDPADFLPAPGQGALAVQVAADNRSLLELASALNHVPTRTAVEAERAVLAALHGGCSIPLGVYCRIDDGAITIDAILADTDGTRSVRRRVSGKPGEAARCAAKLAKELLDYGGREILGSRS